MIIKFYCMYIHCVCSDPECLEGILREKVCVWLLRSQTEYGRTRQEKRRDKESTTSPARERGEGASTAGGETTRGEEKLKTHVYFFLFIVFSL